MPESSSMSNPAANSRKRRKLDPQSPSRFSADTAPRWRTETERQIYSSKLVDSLRNLRRPESSSATGRAVRDAADRVLAASARGRTRWSRALLARRLRLRLARINKKHRKAAKPGSPKEKSAAREQLPPLQKKAKVLGRLVPGCRKLSLPSLLEETTDYIAALEMQVKAMTFIAGLLNGGASASASADSGGALTDRGQYISSS